jgi:hypothetical protein
MGRQVRAARIWQSSGIKAVVAVLILLVVLVVLIVGRSQKRPESQSDLKQTQRNSGENREAGSTGSRLPAAGVSDPMRPQYPLDDPAYYTLPSAPAPLSTDQMDSTGAAQLPPALTEGEAGKLEASPTKVHPLGEAGTIMGVDPGRAGEVGVPRTYVLPVESHPVVKKTDAAPVSAPLGSAGSVMGTPPGTPPDEVGRTKMAPLPKDKKPPQ